MKKKCLIYGNCQTHAVNHFLQMTAFADEYDIKHILCHQSPNLIDNENISNYDLIITQPISNFKENQCTRFILNNRKKHSKVFIFPSIYFKYYYLHQAYVRIHENNKLLKQLIPPMNIHDVNLLKSYMSIKDVRNLYCRYLEIVNHDNFYSEQDYLNEFQNSSYHLNNRENTCYNNFIKNHKNIFFIPVSEYISKFINKKLLFYTINHPTEELIKETVVDNILNILNIQNTLIYNLECNFLRYKVRLPMYNSILKLVNFDIKSLRESVVIPEFHSPFSNKIETVSLKKYFIHSVTIYRKPENQHYLNTKNFYYY
jgi:hypothetical protein